LLPCCPDDLVPNGPIAENFLLCIPLSSPFSPTPPNTVLHNLSTIPSSCRSQRLSTTPLLQCSAVPFPALAWFFLHRCRLPLQRIWLGASSIIPNTTGASDLRRESTRVLDHHSTRTSDFPPRPPLLPPEKARPTNPQTVSHHGQNCTEPPTLWPNVTPRDEDSSVLSLQYLQGY
jgi:hypothetical protein